MLQRVPVADLQSIFRVTYPNAITKFASVSELTDHRLHGVRIDAVSVLNETIPDTGGAGPGGGGGGADPAGGDLQISYYLYDHLGNTRIVFHTVPDCSGQIEYIVEYAADYYPYGKILREWVNSCPHLLELRGSQKRK